MNGVVVPAVRRRQHFSRLPSISKTLRLDKRLIDSVWFLADFPLCFFFFKTLQKTQSSSLDGLPTMSGRRLWETNMDEHWTYWSDEPGFSFSPFGCGCP